MLNYSETSRSLANSLQLSIWLKVLAEPKRLLIFNLLMEGVQCNCELGEALQMAPNLISHHLGKLRDAELVVVERDALDARWVYYSINRTVLDQLHTTFRTFFNPERIQPRHPACGPQGSIVPLDKISSQT